MTFDQAFEVLLKHEGGCRSPQKFTENIEKISYIEVVGHHRCYALWTQETLFGRVPVEMLP